MASFEGREHCALNLQLKDKLWMPCDFAGHGGLSSLSPMSKQRDGSCWGWGRDHVLQKLVAARNVLSFLTLCVQQGFTGIEEKKWIAGNNLLTSNIKEQRELLFRPAKSLLYPKGESRHDLLIEVRIHQEMGFGIQDTVHPLNPGFCCENPALAHGLEMLPHYLP